MKKMNLFWLLGLVLLMSACNNDDPQPVNEEEEITTLRITFTAAGEAPISFNWRDLDGEGGTAPVINPIILVAGKTYDASILVLNENEAINLENKSYNVTLEVSEEDDEHQFFYTKSAGLNLTHSYRDSDANGNPVGIDSRFLTGAASTGTLTVTLKHQPGIKSATTGINDGETDIAVTFNTTIQ